MGAGGGGGCLGLARGPTPLGGRDRSRMSARASALWLLRRKTQTLSNDLPGALHTRKRAVNVSPPGCRSKVLNSAGRTDLVSLVDA